MCMAELVTRIFEEANLPYCSGFIVVQLLLTKISVSDLVVYLKVCLELGTLFGKTCACILENFILDHHMHDNFYRTTAIMATHLKFCLVGVVWSVCAILN